MSGRNGATEARHKGLVEIDHRWLLCDSNDFGLEKWISQSSSSDSGKVIAGSQLFDIEHSVPKG